MLEVQQLTVRYGARTVLRDASFSVRAGEWLMLAGPNGAGKSTALRALSQGTPYEGRVLLGGRDARGMKPRERARWMGMLSQTHGVGYAFTVEEIVRLGRYAYTGALTGLREADERAVDEALRATGMEACRRQAATTLSGGEAQRMFLAQVFAQEPKLLLLDEPTNHLDLTYQKQVFDLLGVWLSQPGRAVVSVVHDLSLALRYGTRALLLDRGRIAADGPVSEALSAPNLRAAYGMDVYAWMRETLSRWA